MWLRKEEDYTKSYSLDKLVFDSKNTFFKMHPLEGHLENIQLIDETYAGKYKIKGEEYYFIDGKYYGGYDSITIPVCFVQADVIWDNHKERKGSMNGTINGIIRPTLDENNELTRPEFHFYLLMPEQNIVGHSVKNDDASSILHVNMAAIDQNLLDRFKHAYVRKPPHVVPSWFEVKMYHNNIRRENFSRGVFVTTLEQ
jgi:hypothetical protein